MFRVVLIETALLLFLAQLAFPQTLPAPATAPAPSESAIIYAKTSTNAPLKLDLYLPPRILLKPLDRLPVLVRFAPTRETPARPASELLAKNCALVYVSYLPDNSPPALAFNPFPQDLYAAKAAIRWVRGNSTKYHFDPDRIAVWGAGHGATLAALVATTAAQKDLAGTLGDFPNESSAVRAACLFGGTTDWRNAELYGDETVNIPNSPAYQLFASNPKDNPEDARRASAVNYIRPTSPPILMITLASDSNRAMHLIFAETLHRAGVASALYEEKSGGGLGGRAVDESKLDQTILEFFADTLAPSVGGGGEAKTQPAPMTIDQEIHQLAAAGLYKQARRIIEEQVAAAPPNGREPWLKLIREIADQQQTPAMEKLLDAMKQYKIENQKSGGTKIENPLWTIREILTDPDHIGEYHVQPSPSPREYDRRTAALHQVEALNNFVQQRDFPAADRQAATMRNLLPKDADPAMLNEFLARYAAIKSHPDQSWPLNINPVPFALASGQDLYGFWFTLRAGGVLQRFRFIPAGSFAMGSAKDEWSRLPGEPILEPTAIQSPFWLADSPVTQDMWEGELSQDANRSHFKGPHLPATNLSYAHAVNFLEKLAIGARLPTEAEYEYALRAGEGSSEMYPVTGRLSDSSWFWDEAQTPLGAQDFRILHELETETSTTPRSTHDVRQKLPNRWGLYDMQGNIWEWCSGTSPDKPREYHPARGGSWISIPQSCRAARSTWFFIEQESWNLGMRILIPAQ